MKRTGCVVWLIIIAPLLPLSGIAQEAGNVERGEQAFGNCAACHQVGANAKNAFGPVLTGIIGRCTGSAPGYAYSAGLMAANTKGLVWTEELLFEWLANPSQFLKDQLGDASATSKMPIKFEDAQLRRDVVAYLASMTSASQTEEMSHGDTPHSDKVRTMTGKKDEIDLLPREKLVLVKPPFFP